MKLEGIITAIVTPFDDAGEIDYGAFERLIEQQIESGVDGLVPCGSTGEYYALSGEERAGVLEFVMRQAGGRVQLIAGTNAGSTRDVIAFTRAARELGYRAVLLAPPFYSLPSPGELTAHYEAVLEAVDIEIVLYNYPSRAGVEIGHDVLDALSHHDRVIALKESSGNLLRAIELFEHHGARYQLSCGSDDQALDFLLWGATSWICGPANCFAKQCVNLYRAFKAGDIAAAQDQMRRLFPAMALLESGKFVQQVKYGCELLGLPVGHARRPLLPLSEDEKARFARVFETATSEAPAGALGRGGNRLAG